MTDFRPTYYDLTTRHARRARELVAAHGLDLMAALRAAPAGNAIFDIIREFLRPAVTADTDIRALDGDERARVIAETLRHILALGGQPMPLGLDGEIATNIKCAWHALRFEAAGRQTYVPSPDLAWQLLHTELRGLTTDDITLPFPSLYIDVPPGPGLEMKQDDGARVPVSGVFVTTMDMGWNVMLFGGLESGNLQDVVFNNFSVPTGFSITIDDAIDGVVRHATSLTAERRRRLGLDSDIASEWALVLRWIFNLVFYVTHADTADLEHVEANAAAAALWRRANNAPAGSKKRRRLFDELKTLERRPRIVVGRRVVCDPDMRARVPGAKTAALAVRTLVAGHYQRYHTRQGVVWRHKQPYWKGADLPSSPAAASTTRELR